MVTLRPLFDGHIIHAPQFGPGLRLFRGRVYKKPENIRELWYPPPEVTPIGRANLQGSPVLYCCTLREVLFFECRPAEGQTLAIASWDTTERLLANHVGYGSEAFQQLGSIRKYASWLDGPRPGPTEPVNLLINDFLADCFTRRVPRGSEEMYKLTNAVARYLFEDDTLDALMYPTVEMRANADNLALKPKYADRNLRFVKAEFARIDEVLDFSYKVSVLDFATALATDGTLLWNAPNGLWRRFDGMQ